MINAFIATVKSRGLARSNRFNVNITWPSGIALLETAKLANLLCEASSLPGYNIATQPLKIMGESREVPYEPMYDPITLTFYMDAQFELKDAFETWMSYIIDPVTKTINYYSTYTSEINISVENMDGSIPYNVTLFEAFPKSMTAVTLNQGDRDVMRLNVGIQYKYWTSSSQFGRVRSTTTPSPITNVVDVRGL